MLIVLAILIPVAIFMSIVVYYHITDLSRRQLIVIMGGAGMISFFICALIFSKILAKKYTLVFDDLYIEIATGKDKCVLGMKEVNRVEIWNNSDYSKIVIYYGSKKINLHVGFANLLRGQAILKTDDILDEIFFKRKQFTKTMANRKGIPVITYDKK